jgi:GNAT superfamily N-acetyltransferase
VKLALDALERPVGMIQYVPGLHAPVAGEGIYFILCIWVHGHEGKGVGDQQGKGMGTALLAAAEEDARALGAKGMAAWGLRIPIWMRASWFRKHGYQRADTDGLRALMWKPFTAGAVPPRWLRSTKRPEDDPSRVVVTACGTGWCLAQNIACTRAIRAADAANAGVREIDLCGDRDGIEAWGTDAALFLDNVPIHTGPPPSYEKMQKLVGKRLRKKHLPVAG